MNSTYLRSSSTGRLGLALVLSLGTACLRAADAPVISPGGVVNSASFAAGVPLAPGSIASAFGTFPITTPARASATPLPTDLAGVSLQFGNGAPVPLLYAGSGQVNFQVPWDLANQGQATVTATAGGQTSAALAVSINAFAPAIFSINQQGSGQGAVLDSRYRLVDASNPSIAGSTTILIFCTGLGAVTNPPPNGSPALARPLSYTTTLPAVTIGGISAQVVYSGLAPGSVGEYQVNAVVPGRAPTGNAVPVVISVGGATSNAVTIAVQASAIGDPDQRADTLVSQMTQDEKLAIVQCAGGPVTDIIPLPRGAGGFVPGIPRLGIPNLYYADGSVGLADYSAPATALPSSIASAAGWDANDAYQYGRIIGTELRNYGLNVNLGGNVNLIGREPRDGRTFETKGEDPILAGKITAAHVRAVQDQHVIGCVKHFALNDQETGRYSANVQIDDRGARESDLLAFEIVLRDADVQSVMCSYNLVNGVWTCENPYLLNGVLKGDWNFKGFVMSDWWATHSTVNAVLAGLDQEQPDNQWFSGIELALQSGQIPRSRLADMVHRILRAMFAAGLFDYPESLAPVNTGADQAIAQDAEEKGAVLLKNAGGQLPLNASTLKSIAVIGSHADVAVLSGGGSAQVYPTGGPALTEGYPCPPCWSQVIWDPSSPLAAIQSMAPGAAVKFNDGTDSAAASSLAAASDVAIVFVSQWASEGMDLPSLNFADVIHSQPVDQDVLVAAVAAANPHTIVVLENGGAQVMPWLNNVSAVLEAWYPGQKGGEAIARILFGAVNPSGKLPITFAASVNDLPRPAIDNPPASGTFPVSYVESFDVGYKWYDAKNLTPLFPFGFGLSYAVFAFSQAKLVNNLAAGAPNFQVTFDLANTGSLTGAEVAQVYLGMPNGTGEPPRRLVGWQKVLLPPGGVQHVTIEVDENDTSHPLSYWDTGSAAWLVAPGDYTVYLGNSSRSSDLSVAGTFHLGP